MIKFGSSLGRGGNSTGNMNTTSNSVKDLIISSFKNALNEGLAGKVSDEELQGVLKNNYDLVLDITKKEELSEIKNINISKNTETLKYARKNPVKIFDFSNYSVFQPFVEYEDQIKLPGDIINTINNYKYIFDNTIDIKTNIAKVVGQKAEAEKKGDMFVSIHSIIGSPSLFNPFFGVNATGINPFTPLLNTQRTGITAKINKADLGSKDNGLKEEELKYTEKFLEYNIQDCSIKTLVAASNYKNSNFTNDIPDSKLDFLSTILGVARYKYADFMYCKDLGKYSNNHLITLRRFAHPVGDNIFYGTSSVKDSKVQEQEPDLARLVTWFGNGENELSNIMKYDYSMSWKELKAEIQEKDSMEDNGSILGAINNTMNPQYNNLQAGGFTGNTNMIGFLGQKSNGIFGKAFSQEGNQNKEALRNYDKNKVYEPANSIQDTVKYEGKLTFNQEFSLVFSYKMRSYSNINQKSAFLDLIGNILEVTYRRGMFWGGGRKFIGPPQNVTGWKKTQGYINNAWDKVGNFGEMLMRGNIDIGSIFASASEMVSKAYDTAKNTIGNAKNNPKETGNMLADAIKEFDGKTHFSDALKGQLLNKLGRPYIYTWDSYLSGDDVGLWHLTIGNPFNPIAVFGNLIVTGASLQHLGPLGIDDFPTEIKVTINLKHARSRDITEIGKMYTRGYGGIYASTSLRNKALYYNDKKNADMDKLISKISDFEREAGQSDTERKGIDKLYKEKIQEIEEKKKAEYEKKNKNENYEVNENLIKGYDESIKKLLKEYNKKMEEYGKKLENKKLPSLEYELNSGFSKSLYAHLGTDDYEKIIAICDEVS